MLVRDSNRINVMYLDAEHFEENQKKFPKNEGDDASRCPLTFSLPTNHFLYYEMNITKKKVFSNYSRSLPPWPGGKISKFCA